VRKEAIHALELAGYAKSSRLTYPGVGKRQHRRWWTQSPVLTAAVAHQPLAVCAVRMAAAMGGWPSRRICIRVPLIGMSPDQWPLVTEEPRRDLIAIDVPIGLPEAGARECDRAARRLLGRPRRSSVFPAPVRAVLEASSHREACMIWERMEKKRMPIQAWSIVAKIVEVDRVLRGMPEVQPRVREVHPEVCFYYLAGGRPMQHKKKSDQGRSERLELLTPIFGANLADALEGRRELGCATDDILDAFVALWTARRAWAGTAIILPATPCVDSYGLPMEMVA
jgi:predicted RNase H-like nuclease